MLSLLLQNLLSSVLQTYLLCPMLMHQLLERDETVMYQSPPAPRYGNTFWGMAFVSQNQITSLLSRKEYHDVACLTETYGRGETCWALFHSQHTREYQIRRNWYIACLRTLGHFHVQLPEGWLFLLSPNATTSHPSYSMPVIPFSKSHPGRRSSASRRCQEKALCHS
jgi:hypothetical protein